MKKRFAKLTSLLLTMAMVLSMISTTVFAADFGKLKAVDGSVELDGENAGTVTVSLSGTAAQNIFGIEGNWDTTEDEGEGYLTLTSIGSDVLTFVGMNYVDAASGKVLYVDNTFVNPGILSNGAALLTATYEVAADTPAGKYTVCFVTDVLTDDDYTPDETETTYTATITVTRPAAPHEHSYTTSVTNPTCTVDGKTVYTCECGDTYSEPIAATGHNYESVVTAPTCEDAGYTTYTCSKCGDSYVSDEKSATGHSFVDTGVEGSHCYGGVIHRECSVCGAKTDLPFEGIGHKYNGVVTAPTCEDAGYTTYTCSRCGDSYVANEVAAKGHDYKSELTEGNCETGGVLTYTCTACGDSYTEKLEPEGHNYEAVVTAPTCTEDGYTTHTCSKCGDSYTDTSVEKLGHTYESVVTAPTCTEDGYTTHTCSVCGDTYTDTTVEKLGHDYASVVTAPTCTAEGYTTYTCSRCGDSYTADTVEKLPHSYESVVTAPTCTEDGYTTHTCSVCGDTYTDSTVEKLGHTLDDGVVTTEPTCTVKGIKTYTCSVCGDTTTEDIDALGHDPIAHEGKDATCTEGGYEAYETCSRCDHTTYKEIEALGHTGGTATCVDKAVCERCGEEYGEVSTTNHIGETELRLAKPATEEAAGYTGDLYCLTCEGLIKKGKVIPKINVDDYNDDYEDKDSYHVSVGLYEGGKVSVGDKDPEEGDTVRLTIKADDGYAIQKLVVLNSKGKEIKLTKKGNGYYFEMPAGDVSVKASFILLGDEEENPNTGAC